MERRQHVARISERPLWVIALMLAIHIVVLAFCALWIPRAFGDAIRRIFGSPAFILPAVAFAYALVPLVASFFALGREYWDLLGKGGEARPAAFKLFALGVVCCVGAVVVRHLTQQ